jgi:Aspartyl protease
MPHISPRRHLLLLFLLIPLAACGDPTGMIDCNLRVVAKMPLQVQDHLLVVPAGINGQWIKLVVDTGAERTTSSAAAADRIGLEHDPRFTTRSLGVGGITTTTDVKIDRLVLGDVRFPLDRLAIGNFNLKNSRGMDADGLLGADILLAFDLDIDVPGGTLTLYHATVCPAVHPPWPVPAVEIPGVSARKDRLLLPFTLDDVAGTAILDTGAQVNLISGPMVQRMGLTGDAFTGDPAVRQRGVGPNDVTARVHRFNILRIGPVASQPAYLVVMDGDAGFGDALLGEQFLAGRRVWLSFKSRQVYVSAPPPR